MLIENVLSELERAKIQSLAEDKTALEALRKVFLFGLYYNGTLKPEEEADNLVNFALQGAFDENNTNEALGASLRASAKGMRLLESGFDRISKFKSVIG
jgi:hypothetical protein